MTGYYPKPPPVGGATTTTTNGWPGKPGVPLNPEKDGWHWVKTGPGLAPWRWEENSVSIMWDYGWETNDGIVSSANFSAMEPCTYLGPCLTPDEATALQARVAELGAALRNIEADCCSDYPPSHGAIKYACRAALEGKS